MTPEEIVEGGIYLFDPRKHKVYARVVEFIFPDMGKLHWFAVLPARRRDGTVYNAHGTCTIKRFAREALRKDGDY